MARLILIKHCPPQIDPAVISHRWVLSEDGQASCAWLADAMRREGVTRIYSSLEPKALETAALIAVRIGLDVCPHADLHENDRTGLGFVSGDELEERMQHFFGSPGLLVVGNETADAARVRFLSAIRAIQHNDPAETIAVVTHGTVISLLVGMDEKTEAYEFWKSLGLPSYVVLDGRTLRPLGPVRNYDDET
jgi:broad specificity phosphatase PhoE